MPVAYPMPPASSIIRPVPFNCLIRRALQAAPRRRPIIHDGGFQSRYRPLIAPVEWLKPVSRVMPVRPRRINAVVPPGGSLGVMLTWLECYPFSSIHCTAARVSSVAVFRFSLRLIACR